MKLDIRSQQELLTDADRDFASAQVVRALTKFGSRITRVDVHVADLNGPRGGDDKHCAVTVSISGKPALVGTDRNADINDAITMAIHRVERRVRRALAKERLRGLQRFGTGET